MEHADDQPSTSSLGARFSVTQTTMSCLVRVETVFDLPSLIVDKIFSFFTYDELTKLRVVNHQFNEVMMEMLNKGFDKLGRLIEKEKCDIKRRLPKRESQRRNHKWAKMHAIYLSLDTRFSLLNLTYKKFMNHSHPLLNICFIPGRVLDEFLRVNNIVQRCKMCDGEFTEDSNELLKDLRDLSSMAMEHFEENIQPQLEMRAETLGTAPCFFSALERRPRRHLSKSIPTLLRPSRSPDPEPSPVGAAAPRDFRKTVEDKLEEQQKKIDAQQKEIESMRNTMSNLVSFLELVLPQHNDLLQETVGHHDLNQRRLEISVPSNDSYPVDGNTSCGSSRKRRLSEETTTEHKKIREETN